MHGLEFAAAPPAFSREKPTWALTEPERKHTSLLGPLGHSKMTRSSVCKHLVGFWPRQQCNQNQTTHYHLLHIPHSSCPTSHFP